MADFSRVTVKIKFKFQENQCRFDNKPSFFEHSAPSIIFLS